MTTSARTGTASLVRGRASWRRSPRSSWWSSALPSSSASHATSTLPCLLTGLASPQARHRCRRPAGTPPPTAAVRRTDNALADCDDLGQGMAGGWRACQARTDQRDSPDRIEPALANEPTESTEASEPTDPIDRIEPADPIERIDPADPIDKMDPLEPMLRIDPADPVRRRERSLFRIGPFSQLGLATAQVTPYRTPDRRRCAAGGIATAASWWRTPCRTRLCC